MFAGIDFGTSNSTVAVAGPTGPARLLPLDDGSAILPSAVFWDAEGGPPRFGKAAIAAYVNREDGRLMRALKSTLGAGMIDDRTAVGTRSVSFRAVLQVFFRPLAAALKAEAPDLTRVVLGRPVHFADDAPERDHAAEVALATIARAAGLDEVAFQLEPIAAALQFESTLTAEALVLIVDIGGGTSDFTVARLSPTRARVLDRSADILANAGIRLGGTDFDRALSLDAALPHLGWLQPTKGGLGTMPRHYYLDLATWHRINLLYAPRTMSDLKALRAEAVEPERIDRLIRLIEARAGHLLAMEVERVKIALSTDDAVRLLLGPLCGAPNPMVPRSALEAALEPGLARIETTARKAVADAGLAPSQIGTVFLTGGSSGLPALRALMARAFPEAALASGDMLGSVGAGLALDARRRWG